MKYEVARWVGAAEQIVEPKSPMESDAEMVPPADPGSHPQIRRLAPPTRFLTLGGKEKKFNTYGYFPFMLGFFSIDFMFIFYKEKFNLFYRLRVIAVHLDLI